MDTIEKLEQLVSTLSNHHGKFLRSINRFIHSLIQSLETSGKLMQVHLWRASSDPAEEMRLIARLTDDSKTNVQHVSCYYALQFLNMNSRHLDIVTAEISAGTVQTDAYHRFMMNIGSDFRELTRAFLDTLLEIYIPGRSRDDFIICSVGTRADQDDLDLGIITSDGSDDEELNWALKKITQHMLVYATPLHLHLSEHVGKQLYTTTISEYVKLLEKQIQDVIIISEIFNAKKIIGGNALFEQFQEEVISQYFYRPSNDIRFHEGFLRGILGEARALIVHPLEREAISPKEDAIRILKAIITAKKAIHGVMEVNAWEIITALKEKEPHLSAEYLLLFNALSFLEMFKFLLQLFVAQEDRFLLEEIGEQQQALIARKMGYRPVGAVGAWDQLIIDYYRYVNEVRRLGDFLLEDITVHLSSVSLFTEMFEPTGVSDSGPTYSRTLARDFIEKAHFFAGTRFWQDIVKKLAENEVLLESFLDGFESLDDYSKEGVIKSYADWARYTPFTIMRFITIMMKKQEHIIGETISLKLCKAYLLRLLELPYSLEKMCRIFSHYPHYVHQFLQVLPEHLFEPLSLLLSRPVADERLEEYQIQMADLVDIHRWSSQYFHRFFSRVTSNHSECLRSLTDPSRLQEISSGMLAMAYAHTDSQEKKRALGDYYDLEFLRVGLGSMRGADLRTTNREFTEFCDNYMEKLFDVCTEEVESEGLIAPPDIDTFAILAAGGHAREQAYDDDYDLIAVVDTDDEVVIGHATRVISRMNRELMKRGLLPHHRLGEMLGSYVCPLSRIVEYLSLDSEDTFIDISQLLGARMIVGSNVMKSAFNEKILDRLVFSRKADYIHRMFREICNRQEQYSSRESEALNLKEAPGGLRDIEAVALMLKAALNIYEPFSQDFFQEKKEELPAIADHLETLSVSLYYLRTIRDLYRITVAAEDSINPDYLERIATIFDQSNRPEWNTVGAIVDQIRKTLDDSQSACSAVMEYLEAQPPPDSSAIGR